MLTRNLIVLTCPVAKLIILLHKLSIYLFTQNQKLTKYAVSDQISSELMQHDCLSGDPRSEANLAGNNFPNCSKSLSATVGIGILQY